MLDTAKLIRECVDDIAKEFPSLCDVLKTNYPEGFNCDAEVAYLKEHVQPHCMDLLKKNTELFTERRFFLRGVDFSDLFHGVESAAEEKVWTYARTLLMASYMGADIMGTIKTMWSTFSGKASTDEIDELLKDETTQSGVEDLLETLKDTRIFKLGMEVAETLNVEKLGLDKVDFTDIAGLMEMIKNPDHPVTKRAITSVQVLIEQKMRNGSLRKEDFVGEIEMLKEKFKQSIGKVFKTELFGDAPAGAGQPVRTAQELTSNHPEARRQRMLARLQRKLAEKK
uniref:Uncharacterized protein n=1 Tax=viral metagenome TaxID=1070528 RepID=A0A6C0HKT8_9ZZZZ